MNVSRAGGRLARKKNWRGKLGECHASPNSWSLSSPQQPLRRRIHQPSLLPHNIHRNVYAMQAPTRQSSKTRSLEMTPTRRGALNGIKFPRSRLTPAPIWISLLRASCFSEIFRRCIRGRTGSISLKSEWARHTWECVAPIHIRGYCPHPSNHLRRRIHQPSLLPHNIHRNACAVQEPFSFGDRSS